MKTELFTIRIDEETKSKFYEMAKKKGMSASTLVRVLILEYLERDKINE